MSTPALPASASSYHTVGSAPSILSHTPPKSREGARAPFRGAYPWSNVPRWIRADDISAFNAYRAMGKPFFYVQQDCRHPVPLSSYLNPRQAPSADLSGLRGLPYTFFCADGARIYVLNPVGEWTKAVSTCGAIKQDPTLRAVWSCLLRLASHMSRRPSDGELTAVMISTACFLEGYCVPRDPMMAHNLAASVPAYARDRALCLGRDYAQRYQLTALEGRLGPAIDATGFFADVCTQEAEPQSLMALMNPLRWPAYLSEILICALDTAFGDDDDDDEFNAILFDGDL